MTTPAPGRSEAPEFVRNSDGKGGEYDKQDCEINAGYRMLQRLRADYPRMAAIIVADGLYSKQPFFGTPTSRHITPSVTPPTCVPHRGRPQHSGVYGRSQGIGDPEPHVEAWPTLANSCTAMTVEVVLKEPHPYRNRT